MDTTEVELQKQLDRIAPLKAAIAQAIVGQSDVVEQLLIGLLAGGHCLLEGVPGLGKTLLVRTLGQALDLKFRRVQFTPDLMPSDILGTEILEEDHGTGHRHFKFQPGPRAVVLLEDLRAEDVAGHQVRRVQFTPEAQVERLPERAHQQRLAESRHPLEQAVPAGQQADEELLDDVGLADDRLRDRGA